RAAVREWGEPAWRFGRKPASEALKARRPQVGQCDVIAMFLLSFCGLSSARFPDDPISEHERAPVPAASARAIGRTVCRGDGAESAGRRCREQRPRTAE